MCTDVPVTGSGKSDDDLRKQIADLKREKDSVDSLNFEYVSTIEQLERQLLSYARCSDRKTPIDVVQHVDGVAGDVDDNLDDHNKLQATHESIVSDDVFNQKFLLQSESPVEDKSFGSGDVDDVGDQQDMIGDSHDLQSANRRRSLSSSSSDSGQSITDSFQVCRVHPLQRQIFPVKKFLFPRGNL